MTVPEQHPDHIAHKLVTNVGSPTRIHVNDRTLTVPIEPCRGGYPPTKDVPVESFTAVIEDADIVDGGLNLFGIDGLHLPATEWERVGLHEHWEADDADLRSPFFPPQRKLEIWASREDEFYDSEPERYQFDHLDGIPEDSPLITEWRATGPDEEPTKPPVPFPHPTLHVNAVLAESVTETHGMHRVEVGEISAVEILDDLDESPTKPDIEPRELPDFSPVPPYPQVDYQEITPLPQEPDILEAVHAVNRHAKRLDDEADVAYRSGDGAGARVYSIRKKALYSTKTVAIHRLVRADPEAVRIERHDINGEHEMWCVFFPDGPSFHQPTGAVVDALLTALDVSTDPAEIRSVEIDFETSTDTQDLEVTLEEALQILATHGLDANDYLEATTVTDYEWGYRLSTRFDGIGDG